MKLISEEVQHAEYLIEENNGKKSYKIKGVSYNQNKKIEMEESIQKKFWLEK